jgi:hypothetical protein
MFRVGGLVRRERFREAARYERFIAAPFEILGRFVRSVRDSCDDNERQHDKQKKDAAHTPRTLSHWEAGQGT